MRLQDGHAPLVNGQECRVAGKELLDGGALVDHGEPVEIFVRYEVTGMEELIGRAVTCAGLCEQAGGGYQKKQEGHQAFFVSKCHI